MSDELRVVVAEDQFLLREGLRQLLSSHDILVTRAVSSGPEIFDAVNETEPDLALLDIRLPPTFTDEGLRAARRLRQERPGFPVLMLSQYVDQLYAQELMADGRGGVGYLLKDRVLDDSQFIAAIRTVAARGTVLDPEVVAQLMGQRRSQSRLSRLTPREREVLTGMAEGRSNSSIASQLFVTEKAVAKHINSILAKLDLPPDEDANRRVLAVLAFLEG